VLVRSASRVLQCRRCLLVRIGVVGERIRVEGDLADDEMVLPLSQAAEKPASLHRSGQPIVWRPGMNRVRSGGRGSCRSGRRRASARGLELMHPARTEPGGQTVTRLLTEDGLIVEVSYAPLFHNEETA
jgi:hypothetical protein